MNRIESLAYAIQKHEGFYTDSRSWRNNNPGNLRQSKLAYKTTDNFAVFGWYFVGWYALCWDLRQKCKGNTRTLLNGDSTLRDLIFVWAPPSDNNNAEHYTKSVANFLQVARSTKLKWFLEKG